ncbi:hypothetical protein GCM10026988_18380 [Vibrio panuliri]
MSSANIDSVLLDTFVPHTTTSSKWEVSLSLANATWLVATAIAKLMFVGVKINLNGARIINPFNVNDNISQQ